MANTSFSSRFPKMAETFISTPEMEMKTGLDQRHLRLLASQGKIPATVFEMANGKKMYVFKKILVPSIKKMIESKSYGKFSHSKIIEAVNTIPAKKVVPEKKVSVKEIEVKDVSTPLQIHNLVMKMKPEQRVALTAFLKTFVK
jgi:hypothetical protein